MIQAPSSSCKKLEIKYLWQLVTGILKRTVTTFTMKFSHGLLAVGLGTVSAAETKRAGDRICTFELSHLRTQV